MAKPKSETWWCIKSGQVCLPYTATSLRRDALQERLRYLKQNVGIFSPVDRELLLLGKLPRHESVIKVRVTEIEEKGK